MAALGFAVASLFAQGASLVQQKKAGKESAKAQELQQRIAEVQAQRSKRKVAREARAQRARILNQASQTGGLGSSSVATGTGNLQTEAASATAFISTQTGLARQASEANIQATELKSGGAVFGAVGGVAGKFAGDEAFKELGATIFSK